jgi:uroporphyrinogen III methyltransferase/synthase
MKKTLFGKNIIVTRDTRGNADFAEKIVRQAGNPVLFPTIKIKPLTQTNPFLEALAAISKYHWLIFTSANGARIFFSAIHKLKNDSRFLAQLKVAAIGPATADQLRNFGINPDFVPTVFTGAELARQLIASTNLKNKRILLLRSDAASKELPQLLRQEQAQPDDVPLYATKPVMGDSEKLTRDIAAGTIHWLTFASPSAAEAFFDQIPIELVNSSSAKIASIGPVTSARLKQLCLRVDVEAAEHTIDGLLTAIEGMSH